MKKTALKLIALCLAMLFTLTACNTATQPPANPPAQSTPTEPTGPYVDVELVKFEDMEYSRVEIAQLEELNQAVLDSVAAGEDVATLLEKIKTFYESYNTYYTGYAIANINYSKDLTDAYWTEEYNFFMDTNSDVDSMVDNMLYDLADCPLAEELEADEFFGEGFFDDYQGESLWDETFTELMSKEADLLAKYYEIEGEAVDTAPGTQAFYDKYGARLTDVYIELVKVRKEIAAYAGYEDYPSFAYEFYFDRDYTPAQAEKLMNDIQTYLVPQYQKIDYRSLWDLFSSKVSENQTFLYTKTCAQNAGGILWEAFQAMEKANLYDLKYSEKKYDASFEMFISNYGLPYVFVNPSKTVQDKLTFTHEFGHFANDYASYGSTVGIDVAEFFSQGLEFLSLDYAAGGQALAKLQMINSLCIYVEQTLYASFEQKVFALEGDDLNAQNIYALFAQAGKDFGLGNNLDGRSFMRVPHFFISPMYIISYVVSNDAALQLYQLEQTQKGAGLTKYLENLDTTEAQFLAFVKAAGLESPFDEGRIEKVAKTFEDVLK